MSDKISTYRSDLLRKAKDKAGKNNSMIARETGLSRPTVIAVLDGRIDSVKLISAVAGCLGVAMDDLFAKAA